MRCITYGLLLAFLNNKEEEGQTQQDIGARLRISASTISRLIKNEKKELDTDITKDIFSRELFAPKICTGFVSRLYDYLRKQGAVDPELQELYDKFYRKSFKGVASDQEQKLFIAEVMNRAELSREKKSYGTVSEEQVISFEPLEYRLSEGFVGRDDVLHDITLKLKKYGLVILCGIGGLGKTQTALHYAEAGRKAGMYHQVQMVHFHQNLKTTIQQIPFRGLKKYQAENADGKADYEVCRRALAGLADDALLIIDNMDIMAPALPEEDRKILEELIRMKLHVLITSRNTALYYKEEYMLPLKPLSEKDQLELFRLNYSLRREDAVELPAKNLDKYKEICHMVSGHTMLIALIAKTMRVYSKSPDRMIKLLRGKKDTDNLKVSVEKDNNYEQEDIYKSISTLFNISKMDETSKQILIRLALSSINGIRMTFFDEFLLDGCSMRSINILVNQSWIVRDYHPAAEDDRIHLHPLIEAAVLRNLCPTLAKCRDYLEAAIRVYSLHDDEIEAIDRCDACAILIRAGELFREDYDKDSADLLLRQANVIYRAHQYRQAWEQCNLALSICENPACDTCQDLLPKAYYLHADLAMKLADYQTAIENYHTAITMWEEQPHPPYEEIVEAYDHLANVYRKNSQYTEALDNFRLAENRMDVQKIDNPELHADILNNIGIVYINLDDLDKALENYKKGMAIREGQKVPDRHQLAYSYHNIGTVYQRQHLCDKAIEWHKKGLKLRQEVYTPDDPIIADSLTMLGNDYATKAKDKDDENYAIAQKYIEDGLKIRKNSLGPDHPATAWSYESLGKICYQREDFEQAKENFLQCLEIRRASLGEKHAYTAQIMVWLGKTEGKLGNFQEAETYLTQAGEIQSQVKPSALTQTKALLADIKKALAKNKDERQ